MLEPQNKQIRGKKEKLPIFFKKEKATSSLGKKNLSQFYSGNEEKYPVEVDSTQRENSNGSSLTKLFLTSPGKSC